MATVVCFMSCNLPSVGKGGDATVALDAYKAALALCLGCKAEGYWSDSKRAVMECKAWL